MVKYRFPGIGGNSLLLLGSSIRLDAGLQFLARAECNNATGADGDFFTGFRIATGTPILVPQIEITEPRQFDLFARRQRSTYFLEKQVDEFTRFALVQSQLIK